MDWFPHKIDLYDADTLDLSAAEDGVYHRLLRWYYKHERPLPNTPEKLAAIARITVDEWCIMAEKIVMLFVTRDSRGSHESVLHQKCCDEVILAQSRKRKDWSKRQKNLRKHNILQDVTRDTQVSHAPRGEENKEIEETNVSSKKKIIKGTRLPEQYRPGPSVFAKAAALNLTQEETHGLIREFCEYFRSPDATRPVKKDWDGACCRWIARGAPNTIRARRNASPSGRRDTSGVAGAYRILMAEREDVQRGAGPEEPGTPDQTDGCADMFGGGFGPRPAAGETVIDAVDFRRVPDGPAGTEAADDGEGRGRGHDRPAGQSLPKALDALSGGRDAIRVGDPGVGKVVASVGRTGGEAGKVLPEAICDVASVDELEIPLFLRRRS